MITNNEINAVKLSATKKDYYQIWNELNEVAVSECMTKEQWEKGKSNIIEKIENHLF